MAQRGNDVSFSAMSQSALFRRETKVQSDSYKSPYIFEMFRLTLVFALLACAVAFAPARYSRSRYKNGRSNVSNPLEALIQLKLVFINSLTIL